MPEAGKPDAGRDARISDATGEDLDTGPPTATTLSVQLPLVPPFSTAIHDYYVRCPGEMNALTVKMTAAPGSTIALAQPVTTAPAVDTTVPITVAANGAIVVDVETDGGSEEYWVRCLPPDFPQMQMTLHPDAGTPPPGYYLLGDTIQVVGEGGYAMALDVHGVPVWYHTTKSGRGGCDVDSIIPGTISFDPYLLYTLGDSSGQFELHDLASGATTNLQPVGSPLDLHELRVLPNGHYLLFSDPVTTGVDLTGLGTFGSNEDMVGCVIQELDATGALVWSWDVRDHFDAVKDCMFPDTEVAGSTQLADPFHCNAIDVAPDGNLLISARNMDSIFLVNYPSGTVAWKMGGATYNKDSAPYITVTSDPLTSFHRQHDARFQPDGTITMFDDETSLPGPARAVAYSYDVDAGTASMVWQYEGLASSFVMGSFRILPDGSRVVGWGLSTMPGRTFSEIDLNGNDLLDFDFTEGDVAYRAIKVPLAAFDIGLLRQKAGLP